MRLILAHVSQATPSPSRSRCGAYPGSPRRIGPLASAHVRMTGALVGLGRLRGAAVGRTRTWTRPGVGLGVRLGRGDSNHSTLGGPTGRSGVPPAIVTSVPQRHTPVIDPPITYHVDCFTESPFFSHP